MSHDEHGYDEGHLGKGDFVHARLRASSTIMQLNKILVANRGEIPIRVSPAQLARRMCLLTCTRSSGQLTSYHYKL